MTSMGSPRTRTFSNTLKYIKNSGNSWQEDFRRTVKIGDSTPQPCKMEMVLTEGNLESRCVLYTVISLTSQYDILGAR